FVLHIEHIQALKNMLQSPPHPYAPTDTCNFGKQKKLGCVWALASGYLVWEACTADLTIGAIQATLLPLEKDLACELCKKSLADHIKQLVVQWSFTKVR
ncbi:hypothetical protein C8Q79DRAFT_917729, partial [Trametes meyenii]